MVADSLSPLLGAVRTAVDTVEGTISPLPLMGQLAAQVGRRETRSPKKEAGMEWGRC
jgi:hypothetical protein